jgi:hypothetical protein
MAWARFIRVTLVGAAAIAATLYAALLCLDPYGSGRATPIAAVAMGTESPRLLRASEGRNREFDAAVIGNSTIQLLNPELLDAVSGLRFVQLSIPGAGPAEQLALLDWFARNHQGAVRAVVLGLDSIWCRPGVEPDQKAVLYPFPFWLYGRSDLDYASTLPSFTALGAALRRLKVLAGLGTQARADGYSDYELGRVYDEAEVKARLAGKKAPPLAAEEEVTWPEGEPSPPDVPLVFPALDRLGEALAALKPEARIVFVLPPVYAGALPEATSGQAKALSACGKAAAGIAHGLDAAFLDFRRKGPATEDVANFWDGIHYRKPVAQLIEAAIGDVISGRPIRPEVTAGFGADPAKP